MNETSPRNGLGRLRMRFGLICLFAGLLIFAIGAEPGLFGLDRSPVTGFVQITIFLIGLALICVGGYASISTLWNGAPKTILSDIGIRLVATGYVIALAAGLADVFGFGSQQFPAIVPKFGWWQAAGVMIGEAVIGIGFLLFTPWKRPATDDR